MNGVRSCMTIFYTMLIIILGIFGMLGAIPVSALSRLVQVDKACIAQLPSGYINLTSLASNDDQPRFSADYHGLKFLFNPCVQSSDAGLSESLLSVHLLSSPDANETEYQVVGLRKNAAFKQPSRKLCPSKYDISDVDTCFLTSTLNKIDKMNQGLLKSSQIRNSSEAEYHKIDEMEDREWAGGTNENGAKSNRGIFSDVSEYPPNITAVLRIGIEGACHSYKSLILLQCDPDIYRSADAKFSVYSRCSDRIYFLLTHRCSCIGLCSGFDIRAMKSDVGDAVNESTLVEVVSKANEQEMPKFMWLILVVNVGVLTIAIIIAGVCCRKGGSASALAMNGPYNYLPDITTIKRQALHSSRLTVYSSMESFADGLKAPKKAEVLDYNSPIAKLTQVPQLSNCVIPADDIEIGHRLGGGLFGDTYIAVWKDRTLAAKRITVGVHQSQLTENHYTWLVQEVTTMSKLRHKYLAGVIGLCKDTRQPFVLTEYVEGEALKDHLLKDPENLNWQRKLKICMQIAEGLNYLHSYKHPVLHRDLRCANVILDRAANVKLVDFGMTKLVQKLREACNGRKGCYCKKELSALPASVRWSAPEVLDNPQADEDNDDVISIACDVYSFGMVMWEVASHCDPFEDVHDETEVLELIVSGVRPRVDILVGIIPPLRELMITCWDHIPDNRPNMKQVIHQLKHCQQFMAKAPRHRNNSSTSYLKSALNVHVD